jgi:hypothetical protein
MAEQLAALKPSPQGKPCPVIPLPTRYETAQARIASVPVTYRHPRTLERYRLRVPVRRSDRERTTYRRIRAAAPAVLSRDFPDYNAALEFARSINAPSRPMRIDYGAAWRVVWPNLQPQAAEWANIGPWQPPFRSYCDPSSIAETLDAIPDFHEG